MSVKLYERTVVEHLCKIYGRHQCINRIFKFPLYRQVRHRAVTLWPVPRVREQRIIQKTKLKFSFYTEVFMCLRVAVYVFLVVYAVLVAGAEISGDVQAKLDAMEARGELDVEVV